MNRNAFFALAATLLAASASLAGPYSDEFSGLAVDDPRVAGWATTVYKVGDVRPGDVHTPNEIVKSYDVRDGVPADQRDKLSRIFGYAMTYDGHLAIAMPGIIAVMDRDFAGMQYILLGDEAVDNGISVDDSGGIYCVTSKYMRKVVWDGKKLSDKEEDGAWKSEYDYVPNPKALSRGSGNTPTLMGFGPDDDEFLAFLERNNINYDPKYVFETEHVG